MPVLSLGAGMKRRVTTSGKASKGRPRKATRAKRPTAATVARNSRSSDTDLRQQLDQSRRELKEALEQQRATSEVLKVISSSPGHLAPVFQAMLENATRICGAKFGILHRYFDGAFQTAAMVAAPPILADELQRRGPYVPPAGMPLDHLLRTKKTVHTADQAKEKAQPPSVKLGGARSHIAVPMLKDGELVGAITIYRTEIRPFTEKQIELVQNFAAQAVIAIENTRLLKELRQRTDDLTESLEQQTATSEVLKVISSSPGDLGPVFKAMLENTTRICEAELGNLFLREGDDYRTVAMPDRLSTYSDWWQKEPLIVIRDNPGMPLARMAHTKS